MSDSDLIVVLCTLPCAMFFIGIGITIFWCMLQTSARDSDTRRYPRYGKHPDMLDNGKRMKGRSRLNED